MAVQCWHKIEVACGQNTVAIWVASRSLNPGPSIPKPFLLRSSTTAMTVPAKRMYKEASYVIVQFDKKKKTSRHRKSYDRMFMQWSTHKKIKNPILKKKNSYERMYMPWSTPKKKSYIQK
jgi:hypothetical protein